MEETEGKKGKEQKKIERLKGREDERKLEKRPSEYEKEGERRKARPQALDNPNSEEKVSRTQASATAAPRPHTKPRGSRPGSQRLIYQEGGKTFTQGQFLQKQELFVLLLLITPTMVIHGHRQPAQQAPVLHTHRATSSSVVTWGWVA